MALFQDAVTMDTCTIDYALLTSLLVYAVITPKQVSTDADIPLDSIS